MSSDEDFSGGEEEESGSDYAPAAAVAPRSTASAKKRGVDDGAAAATATATAGRAASSKKQKTLSVSERASSVCSLADALSKAKAVEVKLKAANTAELKKLIAELFAVQPSDEFRSTLYPRCPVEKKLSKSAVLEALKTQSEEAMVALCRTLFSAHAEVYSAAFAGACPLAGKLEI